MLAVFHWQTKFGGETQRGLGIVKFGLIFGKNTVVASVRMYVCMYVYAHFYVCVLYCQ